MRAKIVSLSTLAAAMLIVPVLASAQTLFRTLTDINSLLNGVMVLLITLAIVVFFWGLIKYIFNREGGEKEGAEGATLMIWGIAALFVMLSIWGIIALLRNTFGVTANTGPIPQPPGQSVVGGLIQQVFGR
ncbi:MAG TPA: hypothetical protein VJ043_01720 [Candidatus Paceibacterota bacterium]|nr:hypothetical protein [Candidatus Paceibacterota bacterium]